MGEGEQPAEQPASPRSTQPHGCHWPPYTCSPWPQPWPAASWPALFQPSPWPAGIQPAGPSDPNDGASWYAGRRDDAGHGSRDDVSQWRDAGGSPALVRKPRAPPADVGRHSIPPSSSLSNSNSPYTATAPAFCYAPTAFTGLVPAPPAILFATPGVPWAADVCDTRYSRDGANLDGRPWRRTSCTPDRSWGSAGHLDGRLHDQPTAVPAAHPTPRPAWPPSPSHAAAAAPAPTAAAATVEPVRSSKRPLPLPPFDLQRKG